jgi:hypothetical protein
MVIQLTLKGAVCFAACVVPCWDAYRAATLADAWTHWLRKGTLQICG